MESISHDEEIEKERKVMESVNVRVIVMPYYPNKSSTNIKREIDKTTNGR